MSYVTSAVIVVDYASADVTEELVEPQRFGRVEAHKQAFAKLDDSYCGGGKMLQVDVYAAGFNHIDSAELDRWFLALPWGDCGSAVLIHESEGELRTIIPTPGWKEKQ